MGKKFLQKLRFASLKQAGLVVATGFVVTLLMMLLCVLQAPLLVQLDNTIYDSFLQNTSGGSPSPVPAIIDIDEKSLAAYGQWPWPRYLIARMLDTLTQQGAAAIAMDILFSEPDRSSPALLKDGLKKAFGVNLSFQGLPPNLENNDTLLAAQLTQSPAVLGLFLRFDGPPLPAELLDQLPPPTGLVEQVPKGFDSPLKKLGQAHSATLPVPALRTVSSQGFINVLPDSDGIVRTVPLVMQLGAKGHTRVYANLALRALMEALQIKTMVLKSGPDGLESIRIGRTLIPVSPEGLLHVPFRGPRGVYPYFSAADVLEGRVDPQEIEGRILFVGTSAPGLLDLRATPLDPVFPGVEVHAAIVDSILSGRYIMVPPWTMGAQLITIFLTGCLCCLLFGLSRPVVYLPMAVLLTVGAVVGSQTIFAASLFLSPVYAVGTVISEGVVMLSLRFWQSEKQKRVLHNAFNRYVSPEVVSRITRHGGDILAGEEREVTLLFTDIRGFTNLSETLLPVQVVTLLNLYLTPMTALIRASGGTVDKFIGDAIMAFWNAPLDVENHQQKALQTLINMHKELAILNISLEKEFGISLAMGGGIHTGMVHVGNMGSAELLDYTCIGDNVNLASRLESLCSRYGVGIVLSGVTASQCNTDMHLRKLDNIRVKGKKRAVEIFTYISQEDREERREEFTACDAALELYTQGKFRAARDAFHTLQIRYPHVTLYAMYCERSAQLALNTPQDWDGVWTFDSK